MKCPNCNQEIIDKKLFCPNCGKQLNHTDNSNFNPKKVFAIFALVMILLGVGTIYIIANVGTEKELDNITIKDKEFKDYYHSYIIKDIVYTDDSDENIKDKKDKIIGYETDLSEDIFKFGIYSISWIKINNPTIKVVEDVQTYKDDLDLEEIKVISIEGKNSLEFDENISVKMIKANTNTFIYYMNTYFEIEKSLLNFESVNAFYKVNKIEYKYHDNINKLVQEHNNIVENEVELDKIEIYENYTTELIDGDVTHLVYKKVTGNINSEAYTNITTLSFDSTGKILNLKEYIEHIGKDYNKFINNYEKEKTNELKEIDNLNTTYETTPNLMYYVEDNTINIVSAEASFGTIIIEMEK